MTDYLADVQRYDSSANEFVVKKIVSYLGIALRNKDSSLVSCSQPKELDRVRKNFLQKKLGLAGSDDDLNEIISQVCQDMKDDRMKGRATFYYLCAKKAGKLSVFA